MIRATCSAWNSGLCFERGVCLVHVMQFDFICGSHARKVLPHLTVACVDSLNFDQLCGSTDKAQEHEDSLFW